MVYEFSDALSIYKLLKPTTMIPGKRASSNSISRPQCKRELAELLGVSVHILNKMIEPIKEKLGDPFGGLYSVKQVELMIETYGRAQ